MIIQGQIIAVILGLLLLGLILLEIRLYRSDLKKKLNLNSKNKMTSLTLGIFSALIYWSIELN
jgi:tellurite resistance protein TehA-like permease